MTNPTTIAAPTPWPQSHVEVNKGFCVQYVVTEAEKARRADADEEISRFLIAAGIYKAPRWETERVCVDVFTGYVSKAGRALKALPEGTFHEADILRFVDDLYKAIR